jgi:hypothetical protein
LPFSEYASYLFLTKQFSKRRAEVLRCPLCGGKLDIDFKLKFASCASCGWIKVSETPQNENETLERFV